MTYVTFILKLLEIQNKEKKVGWHGMLHLHRLKKVRSWSLCPSPNCDHRCKRSQGGKVPTTNLLNPLEKCVGHIKKFGPLQTTFLPLWCPKLVTGLVLIKMRTKQS